jgi:hypothetical protein
MSFSSHFEQFDVPYDLASGVRVGLLATQSVHAYNVTLGEELDDVISNGDGIVEAGSLPVAVGTTIRFWTEHLGAAGALEIVTVEDP